MREFKFRAWDKIFNEMYGEITELDFEFDRIFVRENEMENDFDIPRSRVVLMQWTGLKDKNGVEIYEGDIVDIDSDEDKYLEVFYGNKNGSFQLKRLKSRIILPMTILYDCDNYEVVGNVFENPELLEVKE